MELGKHVLDKGLIDRDGNRAGKVDDLLLEVPDPAGGAEAPEVLAIITGPLALAQNLPRWVRWLAFHSYRLLGVARPRPVEIPWRDVAAIDVLVHLDVDRAEGGVLPLAEAVERRFIGRLPGA